MDSWLQKQHSFVPPLPQNGPPCLNGLGRSPLGSASAVAIRGSRLCSKLQLSAHSIGGIRSFHSASAAGCNPRPQAPVGGVDQNFAARWWWWGGGYHVDPAPTIGFRRMWYPGLPLHAGPYGVVMPQAAWSSFTPQQQPGGLRRSPSLIEEQ